MFGNITVLPPTVCVNVIDGYYCNCTPGVIGTQCQTIVDQCASIPCQNGGTCEGFINFYTCTYVPGYSGVGICRTDIDKYASQPCINGGTYLMLFTDGWFCQWWRAFRASIAKLISMNVPVSLFLQCQSTESPDSVAGSLLRLQCNWDGRPVWSGGVATDGLLIVFDLRTRRVFKFRSPRLRSFPSVRPCFRPIRLRSRCPRIVPGLPCLTNGMYTLPPFVLGSASGNSVKFMCGNTSWDGVPSHVNFLTVAYFNASICVDR